MGRRERRDGWKEGVDGNEGMEGWKEWFGLPCISVISSSSNSFAALFCSLRAAAFLLLELPPTLARFLEPLPMPPRPVYQCVLNFEQRMSA